MDSPGIEIDQLRAFLKPALRRRGWLDLDVIDPAEFKRRLLLFFEGALNFEFSEAATDTGESIAIFTLRTHSRAAEERVRFHAAADSPLLAFFRAAEALARDERYRSSLLGI